jgi:hypothetical protein
MNETVSPFFKDAQCTLEDERSSSKIPAKPGLFKKKTTHLEAYGPPPLKLKVMASEYTE